MEIEKIETIIKESIEAVFIDYIVDKVIEKLDNYNKKALVVFTGATIGFNQGIKCIEKLKKDGWKLSIVLSNGACRALNENLIKETLDVDSIIKDDENVNIHSLIEENTIIIIPTLTVNSCSKIVNCISDNISTNIVNYSLIKGKKVIASIDGCCPDNDEKLSLFGDNITPMHKAVLRENLVKLKNYGVLLTKSENIDYKATKIFKDRYSLLKNVSTKEPSQSSKTDKEDLNNIKVSNANEILENEILLDKKIISRSDIYENKIFKNIKVNKNSIITDLANEEAIRLKINLLKI